MPLTDNSYQITPTIRVIDTSREWIIQTVDTVRTKRRTKPASEWIDRAFITDRAMLKTQLRRMIGPRATGTSLVGIVNNDALDWLDGLPRQHPVRDTAPRPTVIDALEAQGIGHHDAYDLRDDLPLVIQHGPLRFRDRWNARYDV